MKAVLFPAPESISLERVNDPECGADEVVVQVARCGICGTDLHIYRNEYMSDFPLVPGHEFGGIVVETGRQVTGLRVGDRVAVDPNLYCGHCDFCRNEMANHCLNWQGIGVTRPGGFAEYSAVPARACYLLPDTISDAQAAFVEPLACVVHALNRLQVSPADQVLILGAGPMGLLLVQALQRTGASHVVVVEKQAERLHLAYELGATQTVLAGHDQDEHLRAVAPHGFAIVIDATGVPAVIERAFTYLRPRGKYLQFGVAPKDVRVSVNPYDIFRNDWTIIGSFALCYTFLPAIDWLASGAIDVGPLVSHTAPIEQFVDVFTQFAAGSTLKVHINPGGPA
ncbi:MAG: zinc-dependent alcohol dehydrogenase family protein [Caldilineaceae bacterium]|nr:zinc-dependent alcohol dehydrogenase family protein [Caldilineaceae bacterium]